MWLPCVCGPPIHTCRHDNGHRDCIPPLAGSRCLQAGYRHASKQLLGLFQPDVDVRASREQEHVAVLLKDGRDDEPTGVGVRRVDEAPNHCREALDGGRSLVRPQRSLV